ncbi:MAG: 2-amino-4-hydroxy-6-hydroxymethyldihydropteridine diphosphokinase [Chloroflexota bacterium]
MSAAHNVESPKQSAYLALGSNIRPERFIRLAVEELGKRFEISGISSVWETTAEGFVGADFLNAVVQIETNLTPIALKYRVLRPLEAQLGRVRTEHKYSPRTIDIDILIFGHAVLDPEIWSQPHLAVPLAELLPDLLHNNFGENLKTTADNLKMSSAIQLKTGILPENIS